MENKYAQHHAAVGSMHGGGSKGLGLASRSSNVKSSNSNVLQQQQQKPALPEGSNHRSSSATAAAQAEENLVEIEEVRKLSDGSTSTHKYIKGKLLGKGTSARQMEMDADNLNANLRFVDRLCCSVAAVCEVWYRKWCRVDGSICLKHWVDALCF
jgi:hypothetical protein